MVMKLQIFMKKIPKSDSNHTCLAVINLDSALKKMRIKKECKYIKKKLIRYIIDDLESFSDESDDSDNSDEK